MVSGPACLFCCPTAGWVMIDRCGKHFGTILNFLRDGSVTLPTREVECGELLAEAQFYLLTELAEVGGRR